MILPVLAAWAARAVVSYAVKEGIEYLKDKAVQALVTKARDYAEQVLLDTAKKKCPTCDPTELLKSLKDPCALLNKGKGAGPYRGGSHDQMTKPVGDGLDSHHVPSKANYPNWKVPEKVYNKWPAIQMDPDDHKATFSKPSKGDSIARTAFNKSQKWAFKEHGMLGAFALDVAEIKTKFGSKYDEALKEAGAYAACIALFPDKYKWKKTGGRRKR